MTDIRIFAARRVVTMNPSNPSATHVAVRDGRVLGAGTLDEVRGWGPSELDDTFRDHVLVPGMIDVHSHVFEGLSGSFPYHGRFGRHAADGRFMPGVATLDELLADLRRVDAEMTAAADDPHAPPEPLVSLGFDPVHLPGVRLDRHHLDTVSTTRPIFVFHASMHVATVNSAMLARHGIDRHTVATGVVRDADGEPTGELHELPAIALVASALAPIMRAASADSTILDFGRLALRAGLTSVGELGGQLLQRPAAVDTWSRLVNDPSFPVRVTIHNLGVPPGGDGDHDAAAAALVALRDRHSTDKLRFPGVKFVIDGSIQGWTAMMNWPGYYTGTDHGQLLTVPEQFVDWVRPYHRASIPVHVHCNGTATIDLWLDTVEQLVREDPWLDHRHTIQHSQLTTEAQLRRAKNLGMCVNIFANHLWYWGDVHYEQTVGPERANRLEPCGTAERLGVPYSLHSDASVTPLGPLHLMWCAVNRLTPSGRVLGEHEKITPYQALWAVTQGSAYQLHLDHLMGSIECGKYADFTVLDDDPLGVDPMALRDIGVWGTVLGGVARPVDRTDG
ncbi:MAG: amidohydrolase [Acidimicrobiales bacterium]|nr:amidohydrolase [Acidimicrobiales bacterium]